MDAQLDSEAMVMEVESGAEFTLAEAMEMKRAYNKMGKECPDWPFYQDLADKFNKSVHRSGKSLIKWEEVHDYFQDLRSIELEDQMKSVKGSTVKGKGKAPESLSSPAIQSRGKSKAVAAAKLSGLRYEAKSSKDLAWYDVGSFLNHRHTASGELEAQVRYAKFGKEEDEWVNVKTCIRQRSVPVEDSECDKVKIGDLVMCFKEISEDHAGYWDAHVLGIERNKHDETEGCTCIFLVRYDHDFSEDRVGLSKLCIRPTS